MSETHEEMNDMDENQEGVKMISITDMGQTTSMVIIETWMTINSTGSTIKINIITKTKTKNIGNSGMDSITKKQTKTSQMDRCRLLNVKVKCPLFPNFFLDVFVTPGLWNSILI